MPTHLPTVKRFLSDNIFCYKSNEVAVHIKSHGLKLGMSAILSRCMLKPNFNKSLLSSKYPYLKQELLLLLIECCFANGGIAFKFQLLLRVILSTAILRMEMQ